MIFSVIIPSYNSDKTIERALKSVINQTFKDFEIIIVDDGSVDDTKEVIKKFFQNNKDIKYKYIYQENTGPSAARNNAVKNSTGKYLAFLDSDDEWHFSKLQIQYEKISELSAKFISSKYTINDFKNIDERDIKKYLFNDFLISNRTSTPCTIVEKVLFDSVGGFDEKLSYSEDYNLWLKISFREPLYIINNELVRLHKEPYGESGLSSHMWDMEKGELYNYKYLYQNKYIGLLHYISLSIYSLLKYLRRISYKKK